MAKRKLHDHTAPRTPDTKRPAKRIKLGAREQRVRQNIDAKVPSTPTIGTSQSKAREPGTPNEGPRNSSPPPGLTKRQRKTWRRRQKFAGVTKVGGGNAAERSVAQAKLGQTGHDHAGSAGSGKKRPWLTPVDQALLNRVTTTRLPSRPTKRWNEPFVANARSGARIGVDVILPTNNSGVVNEGGDYDVRQGHRTIRRKVNDLVGQVDRARELSVLADATMKAPQPPEPINAKAQLDVAVSPSNKNESDDDGPPVHDRPTANGAGVNTANPDIDRSEADDSSRSTSRPTMRGLQNHTANADRSHERTNAGANAKAPTAELRIDFKLPSFVDDQNAHPMLRHSIARRASTVPARTAAFSKRDVQSAFERFSQFVQGEPHSDVDADPGDESTDVEADDSEPPRAKPRSSDASEMEFITPQAKLPPHASEDRMEMENGITAKKDEESSNAEPTEFEGSDNASLLGPQEHAEKQDWDEEGENGSTVNEDEESSQDEPAELDRSEKAAILSFHNDDAKFHNRDEESESSSIESDEMDGPAQNQIFSSLNVVQPVDTGIVDDVASRDEVSATRVNDSQLPVETLVSSLLTASNSKQLQRSNESSSTNETDAEDDDDDEGLGDDVHSYEEKEEGEVGADIAADLPRASLPGDHFGPSYRRPVGAVDASAPNSTPHWPANVGIKRQLTSSHPQRHGVSHSCEQTSEPTVHDTEPPLELGLAEDEDVFTTLDEVANGVFESTRALPASKPARLPEGHERFPILTRPLRDHKLESVDRAIDDTGLPSSVAIRHSSPRVVICRSVEIPEFTSSDALLEAFASPSPLEPVSAGTQDARTFVQSSSSLSELGDTPSPPAELVRGAPALFTEYDVDGEHNASMNNVATQPSDNKKRRMTGMTSKHFTPEKRPRRRRAETEAESSESVNPVMDHAVEGATKVDTADQAEPAVGHVAKVTRTGVEKNVTPTSQRITSVRKDITSRPCKKSTGKKSEHFLPFHLLDRVDLPSPTKSGRAPAGVSVAPVPSITSARFGIIQEKLWNQPFWLLIAVTFLNKTAGRAAAPTFWALKDRYPTPEDLAQADQQTLEDMIRHLGLQTQRSKRLIKMAEAWLANPPVAGRRYRTLHYPVKGDGKGYKKTEIVEQDAQDCGGALEIGHIPGCGPYAWDSWRIFCRDVLRGVAEGFDGQGAEVAELEPEWKRVLPLDKELRATLRWMHLREGLVWDQETGERRPATEAEMERATRGEMEVPDAGERKFATRAVAAGEDDAVLDGSSGPADNPAVEPVVWRIS